MPTRAAVRPPSSTGVATPSHSNTLKTIIFISAFLLLLSIIVFILLYIGYLGRKERKKFENTNRPQERPRNRLQRRTRPRSQPQIVGEAREQGWALELNVRPSPGDARRASDGHVGREGELGGGSEAGFRWGRTGRSYRLMDSLPMFRRSDLLPVDESGTPPPVYCRPSKNESMDGSG